MSSEALATIIVALLTLAGGGIWTIKRNSISGAKEVTQSALMLIDPQRERIADLMQSVVELKQEMTVLVAQVEKLQSHVSLLSQQIIDLGHTPVEPTPPQIPLKPYRY